GTSQPKKTPKLNLPLAGGTAGLLFLLIILAGYVNLRENSVSNTIKEIPFSPETYTIPTDPAAFQTLSLQIDFKGQQKLERKKREAIEMGVHMASEDDWVSAVYTEGENLVPVKLRLKGDWLDHIKGKKQSFRIKVKQANTWNRLKTFSVQTPVARDYLSEWVFHQILYREGLLTTRYDFIKLNINGKSKGVYAYEEHFEKILPEFNHRREGPIVKFSETGVWQARAKDLESKASVGTTEGGFASFEGADIEAFSDKKIAQTPHLTQQFETAQNLMHAYKYGLKSASEIFDLDKMARYYALLDITRAYHGLIWHNQRFYFNPVIQKLEPIAFDGYTMDGEMNWINKPLIGHQINHKAGFFLGDLIFNLMFDPAFSETYARYLYHYSDTTVIREILNDLEAGIDQREAFLKADYPKYSYNRDHLIKSAANIRNLIMPLEGTAISVRTQSANKDRLELRISNRHALALKVIGSGLKENVVADTLKEPIMLLAFDPTQPPQFVPMTAPKEHKFVFYQLPGFDSLFAAPIAPWKVASTFVPAQNLFKVDSLASNEIFEVRGREIYVKSGKHRVTRPIIIPEGYLVRMSAGVELDFVQKAGLISKSPVFAMGDKETPIRITSSDHTGTGFTILQAKEKSELHYVVFDGMNTLSYQGWELTGAVTFYESEVLINRCSFINAKCEDALNLVRSEFELKNSLIRNAAFDGLDVDFCKGTIMSCMFENNANDGIDFSGSIVDAYSVRVINSGDKGISVGEESTVTIHSAFVSGAQTALAAKDLSRVTIKQIQMEKARTGFAAYIKKPEYGPATIIVETYQADDIEILHLIEKGSVLEIDGKRAGTI
ncbi:MAG: right-handed parallel beta-helix repeat-containing protein, partial [Bacteroidia bacterium]